MAKVSPEIQRILQRMAPGVLSGEGFLGTDSRPLPDIIDADNSTVAGLGVSHEELARRLEEILAAAVAALGNPVHLAGGRLRALHREGMGRIPCPWGDGAIFPKGELELTEVATGRMLRFTALSVHLLGRHGFYQGRGSRYRLEPERLCALLGLGGAD